MSEINGSGTRVQLLRAHTGIPHPRDIADHDARLNAAIELPAGTQGVIRQQSAPGGDAGDGWWVVDFVHTDGMTYADVVHESHLAVVTS